MYKEIYLKNLVIYLGIYKYSIRFHLLHLPKGKNTFSVLFLLNFGYAEPMDCFDMKHERRDIFFWLDALRFNVSSASEFKAFGFKYRVK